MGRIAALVAVLVAGSQAHQGCWTEALERPGTSLPCIRCWMGAATGDDRDQQLLDSGSARWPCAYDARCDQRCEKGGQQSRKAQGRAARQGPAMDSLRSENAASICGRAPEALGGCREDEPGACRGPDPTGHHQRSSGPGGHGDFQTTPCARVGGCAGVGPVDEPGPGEYGRGHGHRCCQSRTADFGAAE